MADPRRNSQKDHASPPPPAAPQVSLANSTPDLQLEMYSQPRFLSAARAAIGNLAQRLGFNEGESGQISLAIDEALCNIINHGYDRRPDGRIWIRVWDLNTDPPSVKIIIDDQARQVDPKTITPRDLDEVRPGGLGVYIIREVMSEVHYMPRPEGGMRLTLIKQAAAHDKSSADESILPVSRADQQK